MAVLSIYSLPGVLYSKLQTTTVSMSENNGVICLEPVADAEKVNKKECGRCLRGILSDGKLTVDGFLKMMREDKERFEA